MDNFTKIPRLLNKENSDKAVGLFLVKNKKNISDMVSHKSLEARPLFFNKF